ncbi:MAG: heavy metal-binding domain-containing protein [Candidatus Bathyarchaeota archaeon]|nr:heavy metal-binding domain-containing protein [Candidatus Bathyarchaeota archaeon]
MHKETKLNIKFENQSIGGLGIGEEESLLIIVTTPTIYGYKIVKILGSVHGLTVRARGVDGKIERNKARIIFQFMHAIYNF